MDEIVNELHELKEKFWKEQELAYRRRKRNKNRYNKGCKMYRQMKLCPYN